MSATSFDLVSRDGLAIACMRWSTAGEPRAVVQIAHGMGEHIGRYAETIAALTAAGFTVYGSDHRGHGRTAQRAGAFGEFGKGGFPLLVEDMVRLTDRAAVENPGVPLLLMGHSMGSFASQLYAIDHGGRLAGLILSGSGALDGLVERMMEAAPAISGWRALDTLLARSVMAVLAHSGPGAIERLAAAFMNGASPDAILNARFEPARTPADWLSRDPAVVDAMLADPLCFPALQPAALMSFLSAAERLAEPTALKGIPSDLPIYLFSGSDDPVGLELEGVGLLMERYQRAGIHAITHDFYPGGRHEMLNETNCEEVRQRLLAWVDAVVKPSVEEVSL
jgi:alpha-beta hydrolase superfamily lysophospholipase